MENVSRMDCVDVGCDSYHARHGLSDGILVSEEKRSEEKGEEEIFEVLIEKLMKMIKKDIEEMVHDMEKEVEKEKTMIMERRLMF